MAAEFGPAALYRGPASQEVARPVNAPNYVAMYAEGIRAALEPYRFLLDRQKALSEADYRRAEIQNFLDEADIKRQGLKETHEENLATQAYRSAELQETASAHRAEEMYRTMELGRATARDAEETRHNIALEGIDQAKETREANAEKDTAKYRADTLDIEKKKLDVESASKDATVSAEKARQALAEAESRKYQLDNDKTTEDQATIKEAQEYVHGLNPIDLYDNTEHPEIRDKVSEFIGRIHTEPARQQLEAIVGGQSALGLELAQRKEVNEMSPEAKERFHTDLLQTDKSLPIQVRWTNALEDARAVQSQWLERNGYINKAGNEVPGWGPEAQQKYNEVLHTKDKTRDDAMAAGREVHAQAQAALKQKELAPNAKLIEAYKSMIPVLPGEKGEDDPNYISRAAQEAALLEEEARTDPDKFRKHVQDLQSKGGGADKINSYLNKFITPPGGASAAPVSGLPVQTAAATGTAPSTIGLTSGSAGGRNLPSGLSTIGVMPGEGFAAVSDQTELNRSFQDLFGQSEQAYA